MNFRLRGRRLYPSTMAQRRMLLSLGSYPLYVPRGVSPYLVARKLARAASADAPEVSFVRELLERRHRKPVAENQGCSRKDSRHGPPDPVAA